MIDSICMNRDGSVIAVGDVLPTGVVTSILPEKNGWVAVWGYREDSSGPRVVMFRINTRYVESIAYKEG